ncbi:hypothetical protein [Streptomyces sp. NPDC015130]|uniref:hypothetical protein n=1 Tax=Streptomyces sp. NPDC015130 TaxID=3364940 RepID=UPI0036FB3144
MKTRKTMLRTAGAALAAGALAWLAVGGGTSLVSRQEPPAAMAVVAEEGPGYAIEDFGYPDADRILTERGITLKRGDGHITLADCGSATDLLELWSRADDKKICFRVTGVSGYLSLEIPAVFAMRGNSYATTVDMTTGTEEKSFDLNKNAWTTIGESADDQGRDFMLMEIRTSK